jgi:hypothetical protein
VTSPLGTRSSTPASSFSTFADWRGRRPRGDGPAFAAALREFHRRLELFPQFGDPILDLVVEQGQIRLGIIRPLSMRYGVYEERRMVLCGAIPILLPPVKADAEVSG